MIGENRTETKTMSEMFYLHKTQVSKNKRRLLLFITIKIVR